MFGNAGEALEKGIGFKSSVWPILIRVAWVLFVTYHIAKSAGWLLVFGISTQFASAADVDKLLRAAEVNARISMQQELRVQIRAWCIAQDQEIREVHWRRIYELRSDLREIAKIETTEPTCEAPR